MRFRPGADVGWVVVGEDTGDPPAIVLAHLPDGPPIVLSGTADLIWHEVVSGDPMPEVIDRLVALTADVAEAPGPDELASQVEDFVARLWEQGYLERED